ncbi:MAG: hypothetical protein IJH87_01985 [Atopobiaceae bacterium]|nr:hypothetical protein [Atopobiaceae bacterium]
MARAKQLRGGGRGAAKERRGDDAPGWEDPLKLVPRYGVERLVMEHLEASRIVCLCAGTGMGKSCTIRALARGHEGSGLRFFVHAFAGLSAPRAAEKLLELGEHYSSMGSRDDIVLCLDGIPAFDEADLGQVVGILKALLGSGIRILMAMRPGGEELIRLTGAVRIGARELSVSSSEYRQWRVFEDHDHQGRVWMYTHGIPMLVGALSQAGTVQDFAVSPYLELKHSQLIQRMVCDVGMDEERELKCAMMLLGSGDVSDLEAVCSKVDPDMFVDLQRDEPYFGVDAEGASFSCVGVQVEGLFSALAEQICAAAGYFDGLVERCVLRLIGRKDFERAAGMIRCFPTDRRLGRIVLDWAGEFIVAGNLKLVRSVLMRFPQSRGFELRCARLMVESIVGERGSADAPVRLPRANTERQGLMLEQVKLFRAARQVLVDGTVDAKLVNPLLENDDHILRGLAVHIRASEALLQGNAHEVFRYLLVDTHARDGSDLVRALGSLDFDFARCRVGDRRNAEDEARTHIASDFLLHNGFEDLFAYRNAMRFALVVLAGRTRDTTIGETCIARAMRRGDKAFACAMYYICALCDLSCKRFARASVRAGRARTIAKEHGLTVLEELSGLVEALVEGELGARELLGKVARERSGFDNVISRIRLAAESGNETERNIAISIATSTDCPTSRIPILRVMVRDCEGPSHIDEGLLHFTWRLDLNTFERNMEEWLDTDDADSLRFIDRNLVEPDGMPRLNVRMLGGFEASIGGHRIEDREWGRSSARSLLALLVAVKNHEARRIDAVNLLWPEADYDRGRVNLYSTISALRQTLGGSKRAEDYLGGRVGTISLLPEHLGCDVDEFSEAVTRLRRFTCTDVQTVEQCKQIIAVYRGDLCMPGGESSPLVEERRKSLRKDFQDAMTIGAKAAVRIGANEEAIWFARSSYENGDLREDTMASYLKALIANRRTSEARQLFYEYDRRVRKTTGTPPSAALRRLLSTGDNNDGSHEETAA